MSLILELVRYGSDAGRQPSQPALRRPSTLVGMVFRPIPGHAAADYMSNKPGAIAMALARASLASTVRPDWPSAAASQRCMFEKSGYMLIPRSAASYLREA
jgi:hypothetical protein